MSSDLFFSGDLLLKISASLGVVNSDRWLNQYAARYLNKGELERLTFTAKGIDVIQGTDAHDRTTLKALVLANALLQKVVLGLDADIKKSHGEEQQQLMLAITNINDTSGLINRVLSPVPKDALEEAQNAVATILAASQNVKSGPLGWKQRMASLFGGHSAAR